MQKVINTIFNEIVSFPISEVFNIFEPYVFFNFISIVQKVCHIHFISLTFIFPNTKARFMDNLIIFKEKIYTYFITLNINMCYIIY